MKYLMQFQAKRAGAIGLTQRFWHDFEYPEIPKISNPSILVDYIQPVLVKLYEKYDHISVETIKSKEQGAIYSNLIDPFDS
jgi:hypothetical protein